MKLWWQNLQQRERNLLMLMSSVIVVFLCYSLVWQPLLDKTSQAEQKIERQQKLLTWVNQQIAVYKQANKSAPTASGSLTSMVNRSASNAKIAITRMQPQGDELQVWIDTVAFDQLLDWLAQLSTRYGLKVKAVDITNTETLGVVRVRRLLLAKG